jgi:hypothetical protein
MEIRMKRSIVVCAAVWMLTLATAASLSAQQASQSSDQYQGTSRPPADDVITSDPPMEAAAPALTQKPSAGHYAQPAEQAPALAVDQAQAPVTVQSVAPSVADTANATPSEGTDSGTVQIAPDPQPSPSLAQRAEADPDGDIVHPAPLGPNEIGEGTTIRVRLLNDVSTNFSEEGETFRSRVASDVVQDEHVLIPAGAEIDGRITDISKGGFAGHGSMHLIPETVILPDGARYRMYGQITATPGANARVGNEGSINPGSHLKRNGIEYGGAVGTGAVTGAILGGPVGALAGTLIGAGVITAHLLVSHPQATLDEGTYLQFMLTQRLSLVPAAASGN